MLVSDGILVAILGRQQKSNYGASDQFSSMVHTKTLAKFFVESGFYSVTDLSHTNRGDPRLWKTLIAFSCRQSEERLNSNEAEINLEMHRRAVPTIEHQTIFHYFDGSMMMPFKSSRNDLMNLARTVSAVSTTFSVEHLSPSRSLNAQKELQEEIDELTRQIGCNGKQNLSALRSDKTYFLDKTGRSKSFLPPLAVTEYG
jgi:hypothetical protein